MPGEAHEAHRKPRGRETFRQWPHLLGRGCETVHQHTAQPSSPRED